MDGHRGAPRLEHELSRFEQRFMMLVSQHRRPTIAAFALVVVVCSVAFTLTFAWFDDWDFASEQFQVGLVLSAVIPGVLAPAVIMYMARLLNIVNHAAQDLHLAATTDPLTGVLNRRGFFEAAQALADEAPRGRRVLMVDLDDFKLVNDANGHTFGDRVLVAMASWLTDLVGPSGVVGRLGGDEFACIVDASAAVIAPAAHALTIDGTAVTCSIGDADLRPDESISDALVRADAVLYDTKRDATAVRPRQSA